MNVTNYPNYYNIQQRQVQPATSMEQLVSMLNKKMEANSPLETAQQALLKAKAKLDEHRNEQIEGALDGYLSLRSRQTSYENELRVHQEQLESFQTLRGRRDELSSELSAAKADFEAYAATETTLDITQRNRLSLRVTSLECELSSVNQELSTLVKQANCYTKSQRQYADYLENTEQSGYAAFEYRNQGEYTEENFVSQTADMIGCMEAGTKRWRERVSSYCEQYGLTPYDFECYLQERNKLSDAFSIAKQKLSELLYAAEGTAIWRDLFEQHDVEISFAHRSFVWTSEAVEKAAVHCVIIGFSCYHQPIKFLYEHSRKKEVSHINGYLVEGADVFIKARGTPGDSSMPKMTQGSKPVDSGNLIYSEEERQSFIVAHPNKVHLLKRFMGSADFINNKIRYCLWLKGISPNEYRGISDIKQRLESCAQARAKSPTPAFRAAAETPMLFAEIRQPDTTYLVIPEVSSERRRYVPIGYVEPDIIAANTVYVLPNASIYMFGVMTSNVHMAWMRTVCSRMKSDYRYTPAVYNNFPWPTPTDQQKAKIEQTAQAILDARALYPDSSLADLYDETTMPPELRKAHQMNDKAVMLAYGFSVKDMTESKCVAELMRMYQALTT